MRRISRQVIALFLSAGLVGLPVYGSGETALVGVAQGSGAFQINGQASKGQTSIFSGDRIHTAAGSFLTLVSAPQERIRLAAQSSAELSKKQGVTVIGIDIGMVDFQTAGSIRALIPRDHVEISSPGQSSTLAPTLARVEVLPNGTDKVTVVRGSLEVSDGEKTVEVTPGHAALVMPEEAAGPQQGPATAASTGQKALALVVVAAITAAVIGATLAFEGSRTVVVSPSNP